MGGCTLFPGNHLTLDDGATVVNRIQRDENISPLVDVYDLTLSLVNQLKIRSPKGVTRSNHILDNEISQYQYLIGAGDVLNITVWDHPELTIPAGSFRNATEAGNWVGADGTIFYPYIGHVYVVGLTVGKVRETLARKLAKYIESPQVDVNVSAFRSQKSYITGAVGSPGPQAITNIPLTLLDAINRSGGITSNADWKNVTLTRNGIKETVSLRSLIQEGDLTQNRLLTNGDIVHIPLNDNQKVFVMGEVNEPQTLMIDRTGMSLTEALSDAGGIDQLNADATGIFIIRNRLQDKKRCELKELNLIGDSFNSDVIADIYQLNMKNATALILGTEFELLPYDVVYVTTAPISRWNRVLQQLLPTVSGFNGLIGSTVNIRNW